MKNILKILLIILLTSCATLTYDYDDAYYTQEQTINFVPRIYYHYTPPLILYWDYPYLGWQYNRYCGYYWCYSCFPYCYYPNWYYPYYYWGWYDFNNHYFGRRYLPAPKPNHERQIQKQVDQNKNRVQKYTTPNQQQVAPNQRVVVLNQRRVVPHQRYAAPKRHVAPQQRMTAPTRYAPLKQNQNSSMRIQSIYNKNHIYRGTPRSNPIQVAPKTNRGAKTK